MTRSLRTHVHIDYDWTFLFWHFLDVVHEKYRCLVALNMMFRERVQLEKVENFSFRPDSV